MNQLSSLHKTNIFVGFVFIFSSIVPVSQIFSKFSRGMYGPFFRNFSPAVYHSVNLVISYLITGTIIFFIARKLDISERISGEYSSTTLFAIGNIILIFYLGIRIFASTIQGGGPAMVVSMLGIYPITIAKILISIAIVRVLINVEPWPNPKNI